MRILLVDDNQDAALSLFVILQLLGFDPAVEFDGLTALARAERIKPDLVITDIEMPGMDGFELARQLSGVPVVTLSACDDYESRALAQDVGIVRHFTKPVVLAELLEFLKQFQRHLESNRQNRCEPQYFTHECGSLSR